MSFCFMTKLCVCVSDLPGDQPGEQHQPGPAAEIQERDEPEEEVSQRAGATQRSELHLLGVSADFEGHKYAIASRLSDYVTADRK